MADPGIPGGDDQINGLTTGIFVRDRIFVIIIIQFGGSLFRYYLVIVRQIIIIFVIVIVNESHSFSFSLLLSLTKISLPLGGVEV